MSTVWRKVDNKCAFCSKPVAKISIKSGKIVVEEYSDSWGCWQKIPNKSEMKVLCSTCQKKQNKLARREKRMQQRQNIQK